MDRSYSPMLELEDNSIDEELAKIKTENHDESDFAKTPSPINELEISTSATEPSRLPHRSRRFRSSRRPTPYSTPIAQLQYEESATDEGRNFQDIHLRGPSELCWRCGLPGHRRDTCRRTPIRFCSRCGLVGTLSRNCTCQRGLKEKTSPLQQQKPVYQKTTKDVAVLCKLPVEFSVCPMCRQYYR